MLLTILTIATTSFATEIPMSGEGHASNPVWSNDGKRLAYEVNDYAGQIDLYTIELLGDVPQGSTSRVKLNIATSSFGGPTGVVAGDQVV